MTGKEQLIFTDNAIYIKETIHNGEAVMHNSEKELMVLLSNIISKNGGHILEIGFGMHISADEIQKNKNIKSHTIIEIHPEIYSRALEWAKDKPNTEIILGNWIDIIPRLTKKFDGILHDTHRDNKIHLFLDYIPSICNKECVVGFYSYPIPDKRLSGVRLSLDTDLYEKLPYKKNEDFSLNQYELKYTIFDGSNFIRDQKIKNII